MHLTCNSPMLCTTPLLATISHECLRSNAHNYNNPAIKTPCATQHLHNREPTTVHQPHAIMQDILATHGDRRPDAAEEPKLLTTTAPTGMTTAGMKPSTTSSGPHHATLPHLTCLLLTDSYKPS